MVRPRPSVRTCTISRATNRSSCSSPPDSGSSARGHDHLQVGLYAGRRVLLPRTEAVEATLEALLARGTLELDRDTAAVLDRLHRQGCLSRRDAEAQRDRRRREGRVAVLGTLAGTDGTDLFAARGRRGRRGDRAG